MIFFKKAFKRYLENETGSVQILALWYTTTVNMHYRVVIYRVWSFIVYSIWVFMNAVKNSKGKEERVNSMYLCVCVCVTNPGCGKLTGVSNPITIRASGSRFGSWMTDTMIPSSDNRVRETKPSSVLHITWPLLWISGRRRGHTCTCAYTHTRPHIRCYSHT